MRGRYLLPATYYRLGLWFRSHDLSEEGAESLLISGLLRRLVQRPHATSDSRTRFKATLARPYELGFDRNLDLALLEIEWHWERGEREQAKRRLLSIGV